jgi:DNA-binding GntR family transcriptional regulator
VRPAETVLAEHDRLLDALGAHDAARAEAELLSHLDWHESFDFEGAIAARNAARR